MNSFFRRFFPVNLLPKGSIDLTELSLTVFTIGNPFAGTHDLGLVQGGIWGL